MTTGARMETDSRRATRGFFDGRMLLGEEEEVETAA